MYQAGTAWCCQIVKSPIIFANEVEIFALQCISNLFPYKINTQQTISPGCGHAQGRAPSRYFRFWPKRWCRTLGGWWPQVTLPRSCSNIRWHTAPKALWPWQVTWFTAGVLGGNSCKILAWNSYSSIYIKVNNEDNASLLYSFLIRNYIQAICLLRPFNFCSSLSYSWIYVLSVIKKSFPFGYKYSLDAVSFVCTINITVKLTRKLKRSLKLIVLGWCTASELCPVGTIPVPKHHTSCI